MSDIKDCIIPQHKHSLDLLHFLGDICRIDDNDGILEYYKDEKTGGWETYDDEMSVVMDVVFPKGSHFDKAELLKQNYPVDKWLNDGICEIRKSKQIGETEYTLPIDYHDINAPGGIIHKGSIIQCTEGEKRHIEKVCNSTMKTIAAMDTGDTNTISNNKHTVTKKDDIAEDPITTMDIKNIIKEQYTPIDTTNEPVFKIDLTLEERSELLKSFEVYGENEKGKIHIICPNLGNLIFHGLNLHFITIFDSGKAVIYRYNGNCYINDGKQVIDNVVENLLSDKSSNRIKAEVYGHIRDKQYWDREIFEPSVNLINFKNGFLDMNDGKIYPHTPHQYFLTLIPHDYNPNATCPKIHKFITQIAYLGDISTLQEFLGYCFFRSMPNHKACMLVGSGRNGKSTLLKILKAMLGRKNTSTRDLQALQEDKFAKVSLYGKLANIAGDIGNAELEETTAFKTLTGADEVTGEEKFKGAFDFYNHAKLLFSANKPPKSKDDTYAYYSRWIWISFPNTFEGKRCNTKLFEELTTEEEMEGFIIWCLEGLKRLLKNGDFSYNKTVEEVKQMIKLMTDPIYAFCTKYIIETIGGNVLKKDVVDKYKLWCKENRMPMVSDNMITGELAKTIHDLGTGRKIINGKPKPAYTGIRLKSQQELKTEDEEIEIK